MRIYLFFVLLLTCTLCAAADTYILFEENGKVGLKNQSGKVIISPKYEALGWSTGNFSVHENVTGYKLNGSWGIINLNNQRVTSPEYFILTPAESDLIVAGKQSVLLQIKTGCLNAEGKIIIPFEYAGLKIHSLRAVGFIREGNLFKHGLIDLDNKIIIPFEYKNIYPIGSLRYAVEDFNGKIALFSEGGRQITGFAIDSISTFTNDLAIIYEAGKQGLINREGQLRSEAKFRQLELHQKNIRARMPDQWAVLTAENKPIDTVEVDSISVVTQHQYKIQVAGLSWLATAEFKTMHDEGFNSISNFKNGYATFSKDNFYGVLRKNASVVLPAVYQKIVLGDDYFLTLEKNQDRITWALRDTTGVRKNQKSYDVMLNKIGSIFPVKKNGFWGAIDITGKEIIACVHDTISDSRANQVAVKFKGQYGIISLKEEWLAYPQQNPIYLLNQDRYIKRSGETIFLCSFTGSVLYFTTNPISIKENYFVESVSGGGAWTIDFDGRIISRELPPIASTEEIFESSEGLRGIKKDGKYGFIDDQGRLRIANRYEGIQTFSEGLAAVKIRGKWGFINRDEKIIIQPAYDAVTSFEKNYSIVKQNGKFGLINNLGESILPIRYTTFKFQSNGRIIVSHDNLVGLADAQGNVLLQPKYQSLQDLNNGFVIIQQNEKFGLVTLQGLSTIPLMYDVLNYDALRNRYLALKKSSWIELEY
jgi:hypothetical protein